MRKLFFADTYGRYRERIVVTTAASSCSQRANSIAQALCRTSALAKITHTGRLNARVHEASRQSISVDTLPSA